MCIGLPKETQERYMHWFEKAGQLLGYPAPSKVTLSQMRHLEFQLVKSETGRAVRAAMIRAFLRYCGNKDALRWKIASKQRPSSKSIFLTEDEVTYVRQVAHSLSNEHELILSLGVDNALRPMDMLRLTKENAERLLMAGRATIIVKGRNDGKPADLYLNKMTFKPLADYMRQRKKLVEEYQEDPPELLIAPDHVRRGHLRAWAKDRIWKINHEIQKGSGLVFTMQDTRKTYGNRLRRKKVPLDSIAKMMRHDNPDTTFRHYIGYDNDELRSIQDLLVEGTTEPCPSKVIQHSD